MRILIPILFLLFPAFCGAQFVHVNQEGKEISFGSQVEFFEDTTRDLTFDDVVSNSFSSRFQLSQKAILNFQTTQSAIWLKTSLVCDESGLYFIRISPQLIDYITVYAKEKGEWRKQEGGYSTWNQPKLYEGPTWIFSTRGEKGDTIPLLIRMASDMPMIFMIHVGNPVATEQVIIPLTTFNGIYLGIMLLMILYNMFLFITNRQYVYLHYSLYTLFAGLFVSYTSGATSILPGWVNGLHFSNLVIAPGLFGVFGMIFTKAFLGTPKYFKNFQRWYLVLFVLVLASLIIGFVDRRSSGFAIQICGGLFTLVMIYAGIKVLRAGYKPAIYYICGFGFYMVCLLVYIALGIVEVNTGSFQPYFLLMIGSAIEAVVLSFAIGDKLNNANRQKLEADRAKLEAIQENERILREQNVELERKVSERTFEIQHQKEIIEEKNKDILDSIHYAKRIQRALLASDNLLSENLPEHFVLYKPKDIVSGDFYWADKLANGKFLLLVGDCTGHGVPGAFMSLLNISLLHESTRGLSIERADLLLNKQREAIIAALNPSGAQEVSKDGMDCVMLSFDFEKMKLQFACANNPLWILRAGVIIEFKPDKQPVGVHEGDFKPYTLHEFDLLRGDIVYSFTDGFADQFGGPRGKKFKYKQLKETLVMISADSMEIQQSSLEKRFEDWRGNLEQVDDVMIIGIRV